ncbi:F0F1 ATP synthase subunit epsilon [Spirochaeta cellobiosiphila]|uniref:F0F1 ATP synthase subunit epsilon n=1 Tax=Spirochaeta cellobiosiphila TaxID=504483 RepID=UPI0003F5B72D|nr:F0F1 ATP synthase subunit epsilon [Spirochaeta cellobiosiphila]
MDSFTLKILSDKKIYHKGQVLFCTLMTIEGSLGIKAGHENCLAILSPGSTIEFSTSKGKNGQISISQGTMSFDNNTCTIIIDELNTDET